MKIFELLSQVDTGILFHQEDNMIIDVNLNSDEPIVIHYKLEDFLHAYKETIAELFEDGSVDPTLAADVVRELLTMVLGY